MAKSKPIKVRFKCWGDKVTSIKISDADLVRLLKKSIENAKNAPKR